MHAKSENAGSPFGGLFDDAEVIHRYSRAQMIADGFLVEVPEAIARAAGFKIPVGILREVWFDCVEWTQEDSKRQTYQDESGRLWDLLYMASVTARWAKGNSDTVLFKLARIPRNGKSTKPETVILKSHVGPGDNFRPVVTIMWPDQD